MAGRPFAIVICFDDAQRRRFLMVRHRERGWELPGGGLETGESPLEAGVREFVEETGHVLLEPRLLMEQERPHGTCWVCVGRWGPAMGARRPQDATVEHRFVSQLTEVSPLAFPNDPYAEIEAALGVQLR